jgi:transposase-like protein
MNIFNGSPGRRSPRSDAAHRAKIVAAFDRSGLSAAAFARQQGLHYTTFCGWRKRQEQLKTSPGFIQVEVPALVPALEVVVELGAHARLRIQSAQQIPLAAGLLQHLVGLAAC